MQDGPKYLSRKCQISATPGETTPLTIVIPSKEFAVPHYSLTADPSLCLG